MKLHKLSCAEKKKHYGSRAEYKRIVKEVRRVRAMRRLNREFQKIQGTRP